MKRDKSLDRSDSNISEVTIPFEEERTGTFYIADFFFFLGLAVWSLNEFIRFSELSNLVPENVSLLFRLFGILFAVASFFLRDFLHINVIRFFPLLVMLAFFVINNGVLAGDGNWFDIAALSIGAIGVQYSRLFFRLGLYRIIINLALIFLAIRSFIPNQVEFSQSRIRFYLGYNWSSYAAHTLLFIVLLLLWSQRGRLKLWTFLALCFANLWIFQQTQTKAPFLITTFCLIFWLIAAKLKINQLNSRLLRLITVFLLPFLTILILYLSYEANFFPKLDSLFSGRLRLGREYIDQYGITWFGHPIYESGDYQWIGRTFQTLDSSLMRYLIKYGLFSSIMFAIAWMYISYRIARLNDFYLDLVLICLALESFSDPWFLYASYNVFIILLSSVALNKEEFDSLFRAV